MKNIIFFLAIGLALGSSQPTDTFFNLTKGLNYQRNMSAKCKVLTMLLGIHSDKMY